MNITRYTLPGMPNWTFEFGSGDKVISNKGMGFVFKDDMAADVIIENIKRIERYKTFTPDEAAIDAIAQASRNIDWKATQLKPIPDLVAMLINEPPVVPDAQKMIPPEVLDKIYEGMKTAYFTIKGFDPREKTA